MNAAALDGAANAEVLHDAALAKNAKEALIIGGGVDVEAADGVIIAVKGAGVGVFLAGADWGPRGSVIQLWSADTGEVDVVHQLGVGVGVCCLTVRAIDEIAEVFKVDGAVDLVWVFLLTGAGEGVIFGIGLEDGAFFIGADAPGVGEIPALELGLIAEIVDGGCSGCGAAAANARNFQFLLQEIASCDGAAAAVIPHNAADVAGGADLADVVAVFDGAAAFVPPHNTADIAVAADLAGVVAGCDTAAVIIPHDAADILATADLADVVAVFHGAVDVISHNAADVAGGADLAGVVAVFDAAVVQPHNAADRVAAADIAGDAVGVVAVFDVAAAEVPPHNAADIAAAAAIGAADLAGVVAVFDVAAVIPHNAADVVVAADLAGVVAVCNAAAVIPHNAADIHSAADAAGDGEVLHGAGDIAKEALIIGGAVVDIKAADGFSIAVKGAGVGGGFAVADWGPGNGISVYIFTADAGEVDIGGEDGVGGRFAVVDFVGKFQQIVGGSNPVRITLHANSRQHSPLTTL